MPNVTYICNCCGQRHDGPPRAWHFEAPASWDALPSADRDQRGELTSDQCVIDNERFFIRGLVQIPVLGEDEPLEWGVWVSLSRKNFERASLLWLDERRISEPSYFGWLNNSLPIYPETLNLKTAVVSRAVGLRPLIELEPTDNPLAVEQRQGISRERVQEIAESLFHG